MKTPTRSIAATIIAVTIVTLLSSHISQLKEENKRLQKTVGEFRESEHRSARLSAIPPSDPEPSGGTTVKNEFDSGDLNLGFTPGDLSSSLAEILAQPDPIKRIGALLAYIGKLPDAELGNALTILRQSTPEWDPDARVASQLLLTRWGKADPDGALEYVAGLGRKNGGDAALIISAIASSDPQRAIRWLEDPGNKLVDQPWMARILAGSITKEWVRDDPQAALDWAMTLPKDQQAGAYGGVLGTIAATDPQRASGIALTLPEGDARAEVIGQIARAWSESSPAEAIHWASTLEGDERKKATNEALGKWAQSSPAEAAAFIDQLPSDARTEGMLDQVASNWAQQEPESAALWLGDKNESADKANAMGDVMSSWTAADPVAASTWLLEQPAGNSRDEGIGALAKVTFNDDPASAVTWAANMTNQDKRNWSVGIGINVWLDRDPEAANQWLESTDALAPEQIEKLINERSERKAREAGGE